MQKFKALFKRGQRTGRGRHVESQPSTAVERSAAPFPPFPDIQSAAIAVGSSVCVDDSIDVFAFTNGKINEVTMEDEIKEEIKKLENEIKTRKERLAKLAEKLVNRLPETEEIASSSVGEQENNSSSIVEEKQVLSISKEKQTETTDEISSSSVGEQGNKSSSILEEKQVPSISKEKYNMTVSDEQTSDPFFGSGSEFAGYNTCDYEFIYTSTPRPSQELEFSFIPPDVSSIRMPENSNGGSKTSEKKSVSPQDKEISLLKTETSRLLRSSSTGDQDDSPIFQDERLREWLNNLRSTIPESLRSLSPEQALSQTTLDNSEGISSSIVEDSSQEKKSSCIPEEEHIPSTCKDQHTEAAKEISSRIIEDSSQEKKSSSTIKEEHFPSTYEEKNKDSDVIVIESSSSEDDLCLEQREYNKKITLAPPSLRHLAASVMFGLRPLTKKPLDSITSTIDLDSTVELNSTLLAPNLSSDDTTIYCRVEPQDMTSTVSLTKETKEIASSSVGEQENNSSSIVEEKQVLSISKEKQTETTKEIASSSVGEQENNSSSIVEEKQVLSISKEKQTETTDEISSSSVGEQGNKSSSILEEKQVPSISKEKYNMTVSDEQTSDPFFGSGSEFAGYNTCDYEFIYTSTPRPSQELEFSFIPPDLSSIRMPENSNGGSTTSEKKSVSPQDKEISLLKTETSRLLRSSSTGDQDDSPIFQDERLREWLNNLRSTIPESLRSLSPEQALSQTTLDNSEVISSSIVEDSSQEKKSSCIPEEEHIPSTCKDQHTEASITSNIDLDSTVELNSTLPAPNLSSDDTIIYCRVEPQEIMSTVSLTEEIQQLPPKPEFEVIQLQDHLRRMEESQYSTNEELQATIQELSDLQTQLDQTRNEKEKFREEKTLLLESLYRQTERLQSAKNENEHLQKLLHESASDNSVPDREKKLIELLKQGQAKRETMISQMNELELRLNEVQRAKELAEEENRRLADRVGELKVTLEYIQDEKRTVEEELVNLKEEQSSKYFEILRLNVLLDIEETKVKELKAAQASLGNENEMYNMMNNVLKEKELVEKKMAESEDILKRTNCENKRLSQEINALREQLTVFKESAAKAISDLENHSKLSKIEQEEAEKKIEVTENTLKEMKLQYDGLSRDLKVVTENLKITEDKLQITVTQFEDLKEQKLREKQRRDDECAEWKQLHEDLLVAVRVANDIKIECQQQLERTQARIRELEETNAALIAQNEQFTRKDETSLQPSDMLKSPNVPKVVTTSNTSATHSGVAAAPKETVIHKFSKPSMLCVNVKSLIESIENANKQTKTGQPDSCGGSKAGSPLRETNPPLPLQEQPLTSNKQTQQTAPPVISVLATPTDEKKDPLHSLVERNGGSKRNALLKWVQNRIQGYPNIEITNFSSSWTDGLALCALLHTYIPQKIPYNTLSPLNKQYNFGVAFSAAESVGIRTILNMNDMTQQERPDWQKVMAYVKEIYTHFEGRSTF